MIEILESSSEKWNEYINKLPLSFRDIYFKSEYYKLYENGKDKVAKLFVYEEEDNLAIYPFIMSKIKGYDLKNEYYDIETAYGYGGPLANTKNLVFLNEFEDAFREFCKKNNIIAEFVRFHPLLNNHTIFISDIKVCHNRTTTYINLNKSIDDIWSQDIISKNRNVIRKAKKSGLVTEFSFDLNEFKKVYIETMDRLNAGKNYYFNDKYFDDLNKLEHVCINVKLNDITVASGIFLQGDEIFHYHLSGSLKEYLKYCPNNLLLWTAIEYGKNAGFSKFHFGGGLTDSENDSLYKFKKSFCKDVSEFYIGKRIHNKEIYYYLIKKWEDKNDKNAELFLQYKKE
ncbi:MULTISPECIES: peptidoglycan bridge formation glycyltransferase FemA/FemB family protein [unclassified Clostridium]|uniref:lipid II:glycine glycyltransferase FemX n=1 Tax=unclassified Clostridium TaxID=2614128 RepID=UPI0013F9E2B2|nr:MULTISPECIES: peptidoglycan bridge formation glycyltransferase FemA/FemB family protein [unclassified Clostridium]MBN1038440.1 peptidoglycan bridge formation glycyltransferase FemA/FemB family protein [Clostridium botulinum]NFN93408.1 peptidoglycan bridge formation glycyltransferase FemA/FemB family protein [Clostridium botulinum]NFS97096.1 peptidoglycan bridge formation glycyltransferase FemA/FemB family protein [Clostridium botulinum]